MRLDIVILIFQKSMAFTKAGNEWLNVVFSHTIASCSRHVRLFYKRKWSPYLFPVPAALLEQEMLG